jgi:hypothetical protein
MTAKIVAINASNRLSLGRITDNAGGNSRFPPRGLRQNSHSRRRSPGGPGRGAIDMDEVELVGPLIAESASEP